MRFLILILISSLSFNLNLVAQEADFKIEILSPSVELEASSIWRTIRDIDFLESQGYNINLPKNRIIDSLIHKSKKGSFGEQDYSIIYNLLENSLFQKNEYKEARIKVEQQVVFLNSLIGEIESRKDQWDWNFKMFDKYQIVFTLYGTGGSYDPDTGVITILTNERGDFIKYKNPSYTIIHEIVHMGIEQSIVVKYGLSHGMKERIVDTIVFLMFGDALPGYEIQKMGNQAFDNYCNKVEDLQSLDAIVSEFKNK